MYKIEKGIPIENNSKYPFREMEIGDSFLVPNCTTKKKMSVRTAATLFTKRNGGYKFKTRLLEGGLRVWRV